MHFPFLGSVVKYHGRGNLFGYLPWQTEKETEETLV